MRIAYFTESLPPLIDGVSRTMSRLLGALDEREIEYIVFSPVKVDDPKAVSIDKIHQIKSVTMPVWKYYKIALPYFQQISEKLDHFKPDIIHIASQTLQGLFAINYAHERNLPVVSAYHTHFMQYLPYHNLQWLEETGWKILKWFHNQCDLTLAPSISCANELLDHGIKNIRLWQRGIDTTKFSREYFNENFKRRIAGEKPVLLFVGRLVKEKGIESLIEIDRILKKRNISQQIVITGEGPMGEYLREELPDAHFTGSLQGKDLATVYAIADIFVFPSPTETFGNVVLEAFASGVPVVGVRSGGVGDLVHHGHNGFLSEVKNAEEMAWHIESIITDPELKKTTQQGALKTIKHYSWDAIHETLLNHYNETITNKKEKLKNAALIKPVKFENLNYVDL